MFFCQILIYVYLYTYTVHTYIYTHTHTHTPTYLFICSISINRILLSSIYPFSVLLWISTKSVYILICMRLWVVYSCIVVIIITIPLNYRMLDASIITQIILLQYQAMKRLIVLPSSWSLETLAVSHQHRLFIVWKTLSFIVK